MPSEAIRYYHYDPARRELAVGYRPSGDYVYEDVPPEAYDALKAAESKGVHINKVIKPRSKFHRKGVEPSGRKSEALVALKCRPRRSWPSRSEFAQARRS